MKSICYLIGPVLLSILSNTSLYAQLTKIISTGQTTGHIATISIENTTNQSFTFKMGTAIIPSKEFQNGEGVQKSQPQIHTGNINREIAPGETAEIPVNGFCLDVGKPPLPAGESFPLVDEWITAMPNASELVNTRSPGGEIIMDDLPSSFKSVTNNKGVPLPPDPLNPGGGHDSSGPNPPYTLILPGTDESFPFTVDISKHSEDAAFIVFPIVESIISTYDSLQNAGAISTPFSQNEERQREAVVQQTIWLTASLLQGESYGKNDFANRMKEQFEATSGTVMDEAPEEQQEQFNQGIEQFWDTFELVGEKAKVIRPEKSDYPLKVTIEEDLSLSFIESMYGKYDLAVVKFSDKNRLVHFDNEKIFLIMIYDEEEAKKQSVWLNLETENNKWKKMTENDILAFGTEMMGYCRLFSPPDCPPGCAPDSNLTGTGAGVPGDRCTPSFIQR